MSGDEELRQAFRELAMKASESKQKIAQGEALKQQALRSEKASRLAARQLAELGERPTFRANGRLFILSTHTDEMKRHEDEANQFAVKVQNIDKQREYLEKSVEESEKNIREMVEQRRGAE